MLELALHVLDILQNAVEAGARHVDLSVLEDESADRLTIVVSDDGRGMDEETVRRVLDPFYTTRTTRHVGLGVPLYAAAAEAAGGGLTVLSHPGEGTTVKASFQLTHPDRQPLGDMAGTLLAVLLSESAPQVRYRHRVVRNQVSEDGFEEREFTFDTDDFCAVLDGVALNQPSVAQWLAEFIAEGEAELAKPGFSERPVF